jgi:hypothetical protein
MKSGIVLTNSNKAYHTRICCRHRHRPRRNFASIGFSFGVRFGAAVRYVKMRIYKFPADLTMHLTGTFFVLDCQGQTCN